MDALECDLCAVKGTPATMSLVCIHEEPADGSLDFVVVCATHAGGRASMVDNDDEPEPTEADLAEVCVTLDSHPAFVREWNAALERLESADAELTDSVRLACGTQVAEEWWDTDRLKWAEELSPRDGDLYLVAVDNNDTEGGDA